MNQEPMPPPKMWGASVNLSLATLNALLGLPRGIEVVRAIPNADFFGSLTLVIKGDAGSGLPEVSPDGAVQPIIPKVERDADGLIRWVVVS